jgi:hypothetical protein
MIAQLSQMTGFCASFPRLHPLLVWTDSADASAKRTIAGSKDGADDATTHPQII